MIGRELKHYRVVEAIGSGGMGVVYRAHDGKLSRDVALKVLPQGALADENARKRFRKESLALSRVSHPHIASLFDFDTAEDGTDFLVMELVAGPSLDAKTKRGPLPEKDVVRLGTQLLHALVAAHELGVLHRDLKPQNIKLTADGLVKVLDFGLARIAPALGGGETADTASGSLAGTPPYMSPEQLLGRELDARTDVYGAGVVLYEMATGRRPFGETSGPQLVARILNEPMPAPREANPELSPVLEQVILKATDKDADLRHQTAKELLVDLERLAAATAPSHVKAGASAAPGPAPRAERWLWVGAVGLALVVAVAWAASWMLRPGAPRIVATRTLVHNGASGLETDGTNVYYTVEGLMVVPLAGGVPRQIPLPWRGEERVILRGIRHDPPVLLLTRGTELWQLPLREGAPARLSRLPPVADAAWSPRGDRLAWVEIGGASDSVWVGDAAGGGPKRLAEVPKRERGGRTLWLTGWHPSGERLRLVTRGAEGWVDVDAETGTRTQTSFARDPELWGVGTWTTDGALFVHGSRRGVVGYREGDRLARSRAPVSLGGPTYTIGIRATPDGRQMVGSVSRFGYEIVRVGAQGAVTPVLGGTQAAQITYSPDGSRAAWLTAESWLGRLWVGRPDGTERLPLGDKPASPGVPVAWSPDGRLIAFTAWEGGSFSWFDLDAMDRRERLYLADPAEGTVEPLTPDPPEHQQVDPCWSADGRWLAYAVDEGVSRDEFYLRRVDLETRRVTRLEGSEGLCWPKCARDGRILARDVFAEQANESTQGRSLTRRLFFKVRDPATGRWHPLTVDLPPGPRPSGGEIVAGEIAYPTWSRDGRHVYAFQGPQRRVVRFESKSGRLEIVAAPGGLGDAHGWIGLDPSNAVLMLRDVSQNEIVVMDLEAR
jgi:Tol biopolymer transport system component